MGNHLSVALSGITGYLFTFTYIGLMNESKMVNGLMNLSDHFNRQEEEFASSWLQGVREETYRAIHVITVTDNSVVFVYYYIYF